MSRRHPTRRVWNRFFNCYIHIDVMLAALIREMWRAGIETDESCQHVEWAEKSNFACIWFADVEHYRLLAELLFPPDAENDALLSHACVGGDAEWEEQWEVEIHGVVPVDEEDRHTVDGQSVLLEVSWCFPQSDIEELLSRLKTHNKEKK